MLKKSLIFGSVALFLMALITLTGCPTSVDDDSSGTLYAHRIYGQDVDPYQAQEAIDRAVAAGEPIVLEDGLSISPGHLNFKNARVRIDGAVTFNYGVVSVVDAQVEWADKGSLINITAYIHRKGMNTNGVLQAALVEYVESLDQIMATARAAAVRQYKLGPIADYDYSTDPGGIPARIVAEDLNTLYVLNDLILPIDGTGPSAVGITALGTVDVTGTRPGISLGNYNANLTLGTSSTLTTSQGGVIVYIPSATVLPNVEVKEGKNFTVQQAASGSLIIPGKLTGKGTLEISTAPTGNVFIGGGDGNVKFAPAITTPMDIFIGSTGKVTFDNSLTLSGYAEIAGDVEFNGNVTTPASLILDGNVTLLNTLPSPATTGTITFGTNGVILGKGKTLSVKITPTAAGSVPVIAPVLTAASEVILTAGAAGGTLTAAAAPTRNTEEAVNAAKKITAGDQNLNIVDGTLQVAPGAIFEVNDKTLGTNIQPSAIPPLIGYLAVADTGALSLTGTGNSAIDIGTGDTVIDSGSSASAFKASGGTVILGNNKIRGETAGAKLTATAGGTNLAITLDDAGGGNKVLILQQVDLNLAGHGRLVITGVNSTANQVTLADQARITLNNGEGGKASDRSKIGSSSVFAVLTGNFEALTAPTATTSQAAWSVAHKGGANVGIIGISDPSPTDVSLSKSGTSFVQ